MLPSCQTGRVKRVVTSRGQEVLFRKSECLKAYTALHPIIHRRAE